MQTPKKQSIGRTCHPCQKPKNSKKRDFTNYNGVNGRHEMMNLNTFTKRKFTKKTIRKEIYEENATTKKSYKNAKMRSSSKTEEEKL